jgi:hypothetical protein
MSWNNGKFTFSVKKFNVKRRLIHARITGIQQRQLNKLKKTLQDEFDNVLKQEEMLWHKKSRAQWIKNGDRNSQLATLDIIIWKLLINKRGDNKILQTYTLEDRIEGQRVVVYIS